MLQGQKKEPLLPADCRAFATKKVSLSSTQTPSALQGGQAGKVSGRVRAQIPPLLPAEYQPQALPAGPQCQENPHNKETASGGRHFLSKKKLWENNMQFSLKLVRKHKRK